MSKAGRLQLGASLHGAMTLLNGTCAFAYATSEAAPDWMPVFFVSVAAINAACAIGAGIGAVRTSQAQLLREAHLSCEPD